MDLGVRIPGRTKDGFCLGRVSLISVAYRLCSFYCNMGNWIELQLGSAKE